MSAPVRTRLAGGLAVTDEGAGRPVVLLHGIGGSAASCAGLSSELAVAGARAIAWDAPGYGESADPAGGEDVDYSARVLALLDELGLDRVDLFGTSWGGVIATQVAARHPERVRTLVLADSTRGSATAPEKAAAMRARVADLAEQGGRVFAAARAPRLVAPGCDPVVADAVRAEMAEVRLPGYQAAAEFMAATDTADLLPGIAVPTLVVVGEHDVVTGVDESRLLAERIPGARLVVVPGAGHAALTEKPAEVARAVLELWGTV
ncbi:alpha/beta fold hydrolase [Blastococcus sp. URHD0036]|uniref:alpha/beta fold hydrolase n=1 Tax=Blastococcus sp. URHD0036 TaxID=1380356 RepID=UPI0005561AC6|nr:alpha/beta hydrolase [Blastococcus sp. URHD0036]